MVAFSRMLPVGLAALAAAIVASPAQAQFDPVDEVLETIGLKARSKEPIVYRERAPLVVPPNLDKLRPPESADANHGSNWPRDPDVLERRRRAEAAKRSGAPDSDNDVSQGGILRNEPLGQRNRYAGVPTAPVAGSINNESFNPALAVSREQVRRVMADAKDPDLPTGVEPDRQYLTEPPKGYRRPAAGAPVRASVEPMKPMDEPVEMNVLRPHR